MSLTLDARHIHHTCNATFRISGSGLLVNKYVGLDDDPFN